MERNRDAEKSREKGAETRLDARVGAGLERVDEREKGGEGSYCTFSYSTSAKAHLQSAVRWQAIREGVCACAKG